MKKYFRLIPILARMIPSGSFKPVTYWRHKENKYLYLCMSEKFIVSDDRGSAESKFLEVFPNAIRISKIEFDAIFFFYEIEVVNVADDNILAMIAREDEFIPENDGSYAEDEHEESEDHKLTNTD